MKKGFKYFFIMICSFFCLTLYVNAKEALEFSWKNDFISAEATETVVKVSDGYLLAGYNEDFLGQIVKFNDKGEEVDSITFENDFTVVAVHEKDDLYYAVVLDDWWLVSVYILDTNLEVIDYEKYDYYIYDFNDVVHFTDDAIYMTSTGFYEYGGIADEFDENFYLMMSVDYDLNMELIEYSDDEWEVNVEKLMEIYPDHNYLLFKDYECSLVPISTDGNDEINVVVGKNSIYDYSGTFIEVYDKEGNLIKQDKMDGTAWWYVDVIVLDEYIYAVGTNYNFVDIYDLEGEYVDSMDLKELYPDIPEDEIHISPSNIVAREDGFTIAYNVCDVVDDCAVNCRAAIVEYAYPFNVTVKTDGNGSVVVSSDVNYTGSEVKFTVEPKEGYVLDSVKVTDANGNVVVFTDYTFTMPSADVTIEVKFVEEKKNPETADIALFALVVASGIGLVGILKYRKRLN